MKHINQNRLCAVGIVTTGKRPAYHDIIQVAVIPLNKDFNMDDDTTPFFTTVKPIRLENLEEQDFEQRGMSISKLVEDALDPEVAAAVFERWYSEKLEAKGVRLIVPLGFDYGAATEPFLKDWLGYYSSDQERALYYDFFSPDHRDPMTATNYCNDIAYVKQLVYPFPKREFHCLCSRMGFEMMRPRDAMSEALGAAELYKRLIDLKLGPAGLDWL